MAKKIIIIICLLVSFFQMPINGIAEEGEQNGSAQVIAYYFYGSFRCPTCHNLEQYAKEAIENNFKSQLDKKVLVFKAVNVEEKENEHFVNEYQLYTKSLILSFMKDGKEIKSKNLDKIWELVRNEQKFITYVTEEIQAFLEEAK